MGHPVEPLHAFPGLLALSCQRERLAAGRDQAGQVARNAPRFVEHCNGTVIFSGETEYAALSGISLVKTWVQFGKMAKFIERAVIIAPEHADVRHAFMKNQR